MTAHDHKPVRPKPDQNGIVHYKLQPTPSLQASEAAYEWGKISEACKILQCGPSRIYEILADIETEDPERIIKTFIFRSPNSSRGTRLFEVNSLRKFMAARYAEAIQQEAV